MKQINSILRTLCLMVLLCMTSVSASAYVVYSGEGGIIADGQIYVIESGNYNIKNMCVYGEGGGAVLIAQGAKVTITGNCNIYDQGALYILGELDITGAQTIQNYGTVYQLDQGRFYGSFGEGGTIQYKALHLISSLKEITGKAPNPAEDGWKNYWAEGIACGSDFYPIGNLYVDNNKWTSNQITDFEAWKTGEGKIDKLGLPDIDGKSYELDANFCHNGNVLFPDKANYQYGYDFTVTGNLEYTRTFKATGVWQAWFVPFDVPVSDMNDAGMEVAEIAGVLMDENKQPYIAFAKMTNTDAIVKANTPYVVKATESSVSMTLTGPDMCIRKSTSAELEAQRLTVQSSYNTFTFGGNYQPTNGYENEWYALNTSGIFQKMGKDTDLTPQRFWMKIDTRKDTPYYTEESGVSAKAFIGMTVLGDDETTGIESLTPTLSESKGTIYNLQGQRVTSIQSGQVYIMNGKKYLAR